MMKPTWIGSLQRGWRALQVMGEPSYGQEGEDRILARLFDQGKVTRRGFYVDVGAHDPMRFSNTYLFYRRGWRGVNIDDEPALNSFDKELSEERDASTPYEIQKVIDVRISRLSDVLHGHLPRDRNLPSFLTVDVEGKDLDVLQSNDWSAFRPTYVLAESHRTTLEETVRGPLSMFMASVGYEIIGKTVNTAFYQLSTNAKSASAEANQPRGEDA